MSFCDAPDSRGGCPSMLPPWERSVSKELMNIQPSLTSLPASDRSCM